MSIIGSFRFAAAIEIKTVLGDPETVHDMLMESNPKLASDVEEAWHGIHFLLTGEAKGSGVLAFLVAGGTPVGNEDVGNGPARAFSVVETKTISDALSKLKAADLEKNFDAAKMTDLEIYPVALWKKDPAAKAMLLQHFEAMRKAIADAVKRGLGMLVYQS